MTEHRPPADLDRADHLSADALADLDEGLLDEQAAHAARQHLAGCADCAGRSEVLAGLPHLLAGAPPVGPVPDEVAARLDAALATEGRGGAAAATVTPLTSTPRPPLATRILQSAAVLVLLLAAVGLGVSVVQNGGDGGSADSAAGGATAEKAAPQDSSAFPVTASGRNWSPDSVTAAVPDLVTGALAPPQPASADREGAPGQETDGGRSLAGSPAGRLAGGPALAECVTALNDGPVTPVAVDLASWQGQPAAVVVLPTPGDPATVDVWVVAPDCSQVDAKVLYFAREARP